MIWFALIALEAVWEARLASSSFPQDDTTLKGVFSWLDIRGALSCEDAGYGKWWWCGRAMTVKVGNEAGTDGGMSEASICG